MKSLIKISIAVFLMFSFTGLGRMADLKPGEGTVTINVVDENNQAFSGVWNLYQGKGQGGLMIRNGTSGETFNLSAGYYYLSAVRKDNIHPYYLLSSTNPQEVTEGGKITFSIQYFQTEEQKNNALNPAPIAIAPAPVQTTEGENEDPAISESGSVTMPSLPTESGISADPKFSRTYLGPDPEEQEVAPQTIAPAPIVPSSVQTLAETGTPVMALFVFSSMLGGIFSLKRKK